MRLTRLKGDKVELSFRMGFLYVLAAPALLGAMTMGHAQNDWPDKPVRLVVGSAAGGGADILARVVAVRLSKELKQPVIIDNKPGANAMLATETVSRAPANGYTVLFSYTAAMLVNPMLRSKGQIDPLKDLEPVVQIGAAGNLLVVSPSLPVSNLKELENYIKASANGLSYGSWGVGSGGHLMMEQFLGMLGQKMTHVPYQGAALVATAILGESIKIGWVDVSSQTQQIKAGKLRAIAVSGTQRLPQLPEVPTMTEQGYPLTTMAWYGLFTPSKTPSAVVQKLNAAVRTMLADPEFKAQLNDFNLPDPPLTTPEQFRQRIVEDTQAWAQILKATKITLD